MIKKEKDKRCDGSNCLLKTDCYFFISIPKEFDNFKSPIKDGKCAKFIDITSGIRKNNIK